MKLGFRAADAYTARHLHDEVGVAAADEVVHVGVVANEKPHDVAEAPASAHTQKNAPTNKNKRNYITKEGWLTCWRLSSAAGILTS